MSIMYEASLNTCARRSFTRTDKHHGSRRLVGVRSQTILYNIVDSCQSPLVKLEVPVEVPCRGEERPEYEPRRMAGH